MVGRHSERVVVWERVSVDRSLEVQVTSFSLCLLCLLLFLHDLGNVHAVSRRGGAGAAPAGSEVWARVCVGQVPNDVIHSVTCSRSASCRQGRHGKLPWSAAETGKGAQILNFKPSSDEVSAPYDSLLRPSIVQVGFPTTRQINHTINSPLSAFSGCQASRFPSLTRHLSHPTSRTVSWNWPCSSNRNPSRTMSANRSTASSGQQNTSLLVRQPQNLSLGRKN